MWRGSPGRSLLAIVPSGCDEAAAAKQIKSWMEDNFRPPEESKLDRFVIARIAADGVSSCEKFIARLEREFRRSVGNGIIVEIDEEPSITLDCLVETLHELEYYPVLVVERFHSFARIADNKLLAFLSRLRELEHAKQVTTIALSPVDYDAMRRRFPAYAPFVNSVYGDNHDRAIMSPLGFADFLFHASLFGLSEEHAAAIFAYGGGPDLVYQALMDESTEGLQNIEERCVRRLCGPLNQFLINAVDPLSENLALLENLSRGCLSFSELSYIKHLPQKDFLIKADCTSANVSSGRVLSAAIRMFAEDARITNRHDSRRPFQGSSSEERTNMKSVIRILFLAANPSATTQLDLEDEVRSIELELCGTLYRDRIQFVAKHAVRPDDLLRYLRSVKPDVIHFSGHGSVDGLILRDDVGGFMPVSGAALAKFLKDRSVSLVLLNACFSDGHAAAISSSVKSVVGTTREVGDEAARRFSVAFYRTLGNGFMVGEAFRDGTDSLALHDLEDVYDIFGDHDLCLF